MTIKVYGMAVSGATSVVLATLFEKEVTDYELVTVDVNKGEQKKPEYLALQPFGVIPVMQDCDLTMFESRAIVRVIADKFEKQGTPLYGSTLKDRALVEQWLEVESHNYHPAMAPLVVELVLKPWRGGATDLVVVDEHIAKVEKLLDIYEAHLAKSKYLAGDFFSLADLSHIQGAHYLFTVAKKGELLETRPHVKAWFDDISSRPSWKKVQVLVDAWKKEQVDVVPKS